MSLENKGQHPSFQVFVDPMTHFNQKAFHNEVVLMLEESTRTGKIMPHSNNRVIVKFKDGSTGSYGVKNLKDFSVGVGVFINEMYLNGRRGSSHIRGFV